MDKLKVILLFPTLLILDVLISLTGVETWKNSRALSNNTTKKKMAQVTHTVDITYGSYFEEGYKVTCDENADLSVITGKVTRLLSLNFLPMSSVKVKITNSVYHNDAVSEW